VSPRRRRRGPSRTNRARQTASQRDFWGVDLALDEALPIVRPCDDPTAMIRSLGPPPLPGRETVAEHYFAVVYDKTAAVARALAAANGVLQLEDDELDD
jgi:hypothetical protein